MTSPKRPPTALALGALGVVFGDIGTSPLYTLSECLSPSRGVHPTPENVLGVLSLIFWSLLVVVALKYLTFVLRADSHGEGGIFALYAILSEHLPAPRATGLRWTTALVLVGAGLLFGDGIITPAISVLSAIEGVELVAPAAREAVVPATCLILVGLFALQSRGTGAIGRLFGPVMLIWFITLAALGARQIVAKPQVLAALNPAYALRFFFAHGFHGFLVLGSVVLALTGAEALYADLGHFGRVPIRVAWFGLVMPALVLCYFGQGALLLVDPRAHGAPFFALVPRGPWTYGLTALSAVATIIASQALISGVFSLTHQAVQLGFFPLVTVLHTSRRAEGQVYVPQVNWGLAAACVTLVIVFRHSARLAAAYGLAVTGTMVITSLVFFEVTRAAWRWRRRKAIPLLVLFLSFDVPLFGASLTKFGEGGFIPVLIGLAFFAVMYTWKRGWMFYREQLASTASPLDQFMSQKSGNGIARIPGTGVFVSGEADGVPPVVSNFVERVRALPERVVMLTMTTVRAPHALDMNLERLNEGIYKLSVRQGFMDRPDVPAAVAAASERFDLALDLRDITYYVGHHTFVASAAGRMDRISSELFAFLVRNVRPATQHFSIPPRQVVEIGSLIDL